MFFEEGLIGFQNTLTQITDVSGFAIHNVTAPEGMKSRSYSRRMKGDGLYTQNVRLYANIICFRYFIITAVKKVDQPANQIYDQLDNNEQIKNISPA